MKECPGCIVRFPLEVSQSSVFYVFDRSDPRNPDPNGASSQSQNGPLAGSGVILSRRSRLRQLVPVTRHPCFAPSCRDAVCLRSLMLLPPAPDDLPIAFEVRPVESRTVTSGGVQTAERPQLFRNSRRSSSQSAPSFSVERHNRNSCAFSNHTGHSSGSQRSLPHFGCCMFFLRKETCSRGYWHRPLRLDI